jgi:hypothetical protein
MANMKMPLRRSKTQRPGIWKFSTFSVYAYSKQAGSAKLKRYGAVPLRSEACIRPMLKIST